MFLRAKKRNSVFTPSRILVIQTAFLGDAFLSIPLLKALRFKFPNAEICFLCRNGLGDFFVKSGLVNSAIDVDKKTAVKRNEAFKKAKEFLPDLVISAHRSLRTALLVKSLGAKMTIGFKDPWSFWAYSKSVKRNKKFHDVLRQLSLLIPLVDVGERLDFDHLPKEILYPELIMPSSEAFELVRGAVAIAPGSQWATKRWGIDGFAECAIGFLSQGRKVVVIGGPEEVGMARDLITQIEKTVQSENVFNFAGKTNIFELAQLLSICELLISNDSGAMHVATTVGIPVVSIFGPTVPSQGYAPWSKKSVVVETTLPCRPCGTHGPRSCPLRHHNCMKGISSSQVLIAARSLLQEGRR